MIELESFKRANGEFLNALGKVDQFQWKAPTPNPEWDVGFLVLHMVVGIVWVPHVLSGQTIVAAGNKFDGDLLGSDPLAVAKAACAAAEAAVAAVGDLGSVVHLSYGDVPARTYLRHQIIDITLHTWDLLAAIGVDTKLDPELVEVVYEWLAPEAESWRGAGVLGPAVKVVDSADTQTKLLALAGRHAV